MANKWKVVIIAMLFVVVVAVVLGATTIFSGLNYFDALKDIRSMGIALSTPILLWAVGQGLENTKIPMPVVENVFISIILLALCVSTLSITTIITKLSYLGALQDVKSMGVSLSVLILVWANVAFDKTDIPRSISHYTIMSILFLLWASCAYYIVSSEFPLKNLSSDLVWAWHWQVEHKTLVVGAIVALSGYWFLRDRLNRISDWFIDKIVGKNIRHELGALSEDEYRALQDKVKASIKDINQ